MLPPPARPARAALRLRAAVHRALDRALPSDAALWLQSASAIRFHVLAAAVELGVADELARRPGRRATARELAATLGLDADHLHRVLRALALDGFVTLDRRGRFRLTRLGLQLRRDDPDMLAPWIRYQALDSTTAAWRGLADAVRTGEPAFPAVHGRSVWDHFAANPDEERLFAAAMRNLTRLDMPGIVAFWPWPERGTLCDVAGGAGTLLAGVLAARPGLRGILVETPGVLAEAGAVLREAGVADRVELREGSIFDGFEAAADVYVLKDILHDYDDERCARILAVVAAAMPPGASLVTLDIEQEPNVPEPVASLVDVQMLTQCDGGRQRSVDERRALLLAAGLEPGEVRRTAGTTMVEGRRLPS